MWPHGQQSEERARLPSGPHAYFPLTRQNMKTNFGRVMQQFLACDGTELDTFKTITAQLYTPDAQFHYPAASLYGRDAVLSFWVLFLLGRAVQRLDLYRRHAQYTWDPDSLQLIMQLECWQHWTWLPWLNWLTGRLPVWKVWSEQVFQFREHPSDGPDALRICYQEELRDQFVFFGMFPVGLYAIRSDPGTPLHCLLRWGRDLMGWWLQLNVQLLEGLQRALGLV